MPVLVDTGILLRALNRDDPLHETARRAVRTLRARKEPIVTTLQNVSEFWNVCTRPQSARGGLGLTVEQVEKRLKLLERIFAVTADPPGHYECWRNLVVSRRVLGVQVHDAKLVAFMTLHGITQILTFNEHDFSRYPGITVLTPGKLVVP